MRAAVTAPATAWSGMRERVRALRRRAATPGPRPAAASRSRALPLARRGGAALTRRRRGAACVRVLIADDQALVRAGFQMILDAEDDLDVVGEAADGAEAVELARAPASPTSC